MTASGIDGLPCNGCVMPAGNPAAALFLVRRSSAGSSRIGPLQRADGSPERIAPLRAAQTGNHLARGRCAYSCGRFLRQAGLACPARPRLHDKPPMLLRHRALLVVTRDARLLAFA